MGSNLHTLEGSGYIKTNSLLGMIGETKLKDMAREWRIF